MDYNWKVAWCKKYDKPTPTVEGHLCTNITCNGCSNLLIINDETEKKELRKDGLTDQEGIIMDHLIKSWNAFITLKRQHPNELNDFGDGIHKCQYQLAMRILRRDYPEGYPIKS